MNDQLTTGPKGLNLIKRDETCRLDVYNDGYGFLTVGWGHMLGKNSKLKLHDRITQDEADALLVSDLGKSEADVKAHVKVELTQNQFDALVCLVFNLGSLSAAPTLLGLINAKNFTGAKIAFARYNRSAGKVSNGLIRRRAEEGAIFAS